MSEDDSLYISDKDTIHSDDELQIKICNEEEIKESLELMILKQNSSNETKHYCSDETPMLENNKYSRSITPKHNSQSYKLHNRKTGLTNYNDSIIINKHMLSPPYGTANEQPSSTLLEKQLDDVRKKFERQRRMESQLGLTPGVRSTLLTPANECIDTDDMLDRREELGFRRRTFWKTCCGQIIDRRATQFFVQVMIGSGVMLFCMAKIWQAVPLTGCTGEDTTVYFSLLSALVGFYIPSPSMDKQ